MDQLSEKYRRNILVIGIFKEKLCLCFTIHDYLDLLNAINGQ